MAEVMGPLLRPDEEKLFKGQPKGFPFAEELTKIEDVMLPEGDDMGIPSEDDDDIEDEVQEESGFGSVIGTQLDYNPLAPHLASCSQPPNIVAYFPVISELA
jgi:hypothetical protein